MKNTTDGRGVLYPTKLPTFHREPAPEDLEMLIRWFWIPRWDLGAGRTSRQRLLPFPASNLVVESDGVSLSGPTSGSSHRDLQGRGWAVGALLRPAGIAALHSDPQLIRDEEVRFDAPSLHAAVSKAMEHVDKAAGNQAAVAAFSGWARKSLVLPDEAALLANAMEDIIASDHSIVRVDQLAHQLHCSPRSVQRLAQRYIGLTPLAMIRRYRLQEAAQRLREDPLLTIAQVAAKLGYSDHAHLSADFRKVLGQSPNFYRNGPGHIA